MACEDQMERARKFRQRCWTTSEHYPKPLLNSEKAQAAEAWELVPWLADYVDQLESLLKEKGIPLPPHKW